MKIVTDEKLLRQKCATATLDEAKEIASHLIDTLWERKDDDVGLAAPQIGIQKQVCIVRAKDLVVLVNPRIVDSAGEVWYQEGCLSFPGASVRTKRFEDITVEADYLGTAQMALTCPDGVFNSDIEWEENAKVFFTRNDRVAMEDDNALLECIAVQHEVDHLEGILMFDREWEYKPVKVGKKVKPNEKCPCGSGKKYKKCCGKV